MTTPDATFDPHRARELALHIAASSPAPTTDYINAVMFYADQAALQQLDRSITGATYQRTNGVPFPQNIAEVHKNMTTGGHATTRHEFDYTKVTRYLHPCRPAQLELFSSDELQLANTIIDRFANATPSQVMNAAVHDLGYTHAAPYSPACIPALSHRPSQGTSVEPPRGQDSATAP